MPSKPRPKSLGDLLRQAKADAPAAPRRPADEAPPLAVRSVALTPAAQATLEYIDCPGLRRDRPQGQRVGHSAGAVAVGRTGAPRGRAYPPDRGGAAVGRSGVGKGTDTTVMSYEFIGHQPH